MLSQRAAKLVKPASQLTKSNLFLQQLSECFKHFPDGYASLTKKIEEKNGFRNKLYGLNGLKYVMELNIVDQASLIAWRDNLLKLPAFNEERNIDLIRAVGFLTLTSGEIKHLVFLSDPTINKNHYLAYLDVMENINSQFKIGNFSLAMFEDKKLFSKDKKDVLNYLGDTFFVLNAFLKRATELQIRITRIGKPSVEYVDRDVEAAFRMIYWKCLEIEKITEKYNKYQLNLALNFEMDVKNAIFPFNDANLVIQTSANEVRDHQNTLITNLGPTFYQTDRSFTQFNNNDLYASAAEFAYPALQCKPASVVKHSAKL